MHLGRKQVVSYAVTLLLLGLIIAFVVYSLEDFKSLKLANPQYLLLIVGILLVNLYAMGRLMEVVLRPLGIKLSPVETFGLSVLTRFANYIAPGYFGLVMRSGYLKKRHSFPLNQFLASLAAVNLIFYAISAITGLVTLFLLRSTGQHNYAVPLILGAIIAIALAIFFLPVWELRGKHRLIVFINKIGRGWLLIRSDRKVVLAAVWWSLVGLLSFAVMMLLEFRVFGYQISFFGSLFITALSSLNAVIAITPGGLGINEGLVVLGGQIIGIPAPLALAAALLRRGLVFSIIALLSLYFSHRLFGENLSQTVHKQSNRPPSQ